MTLRTTEDIKDQLARDLNAHLAADEKVRTLIMHCNWVYRCDCEECVYEKWGLTSQTK